MKYKILEAYKISEIEAAVNMAMQSGWIPLGGVAVSEVEYESLGDKKTSCRFFQAITKPK